MEIRSIINHFQPSSQRMQGGVQSSKFLSRVQSLSGERPMVKLSRNQAKVAS